MRKLFFVWLIILLCISCTVQKNREEGVCYIFEKSKMNVFQEVFKIDSNKIISLDFSDSTMIGANPSFLFDGTSFLIYSPESSSSVLRYDKDGKFINKIGSIGSGPGEYAIIYDLNINPAKKTIDVLSDNYIYQYHEDGCFVDALTNPFPASSFAIDKAGNYWLYIGIQTPETDGRIVKCNTKMKHEKEYLNTQMLPLPLSELNFNKGVDITFKESLNHILYKIDDGVFKTAYTLKLPGYELPDNLDDLKPEDVLSELQNRSYAIIRNYLENKKYICIQLFLYEANIEKPQIAYWMIDKKNKKDAIYTLDKNISYESYLCYPQYLSEENDLFFMGYLEGTEYDYFDSNVNPSIVVYNIDDIF
ncbi:6-bladed beta-propeller [Phocaeicola sp.]